MTVGWQAEGEGEGEPPPSNTGGGCGGELQPASAMRGDGGPGSGDDVLVSAADSPVNTMRYYTTVLCDHSQRKRTPKGFLDARRLETR